MQYGIGVDVGGTTVKLGLFDQNGVLLRRGELPTHSGAGQAQLLPDIARSIGELLRQEQLTPEQVFGVGVGVPGQVSEQGMVLCCANLGWGVFDLPGELGRLTGLPVAVGNDATIAALGEHSFGGGRGCGSSLMVTLGTGVGGGLVVGGRVIHGAHGVAGEIGHITVNREETLPCGCGKRGCLEQYASAPGIVRLARQRLDSSAEPSALRAMGSFDCKAVFDCAAAGDAVARAALEQAYAYLGEAIANACCVFDPEIVLLGGGVSGAGQTLLDNVHAQFLKRVFRSGSTTRFALAALGSDAGIYGCFCLARNAFPEQN